MIACSSLARGSRYHNEVYFIGRSKDTTQLARAECTSSITNDTLYGDIIDGTTCTKGCMDALATWLKLQETLLIGSLICLSWHWTQCMMGSSVWLRDFPRETPFSVAMGKRVTRERPIHTSSSGVLVQFRVDVYSYFFVSQTKQWSSQQYWWSQWSGGVQS